MNRQEYTEQMKDLCSKQAELKIAHMQAIDDVEAKSKRLINDIVENTRIRKGQLKANYHRKQMELEFAKQQLRADYLDEHPEEVRRDNESE